MKHLLVSFGVMTLFATGTSLASEICASVVLYDDGGAFESCQITNGENISFLEAGDTTEETCKSTCTFMSEIHAMAAESRDLDTAAGF